MHKEVKDKVFAMNKKILPFLVVVFMIFQTIASTAFAQSSATEENNATILNETAVAQMGVSVNRRSSSTAYIMYMYPIEDSTQAFTAYYAIDKNEQMPSTADMSLWTGNGLLLGNSTYSLNLSNLSAGPLYLHMVVTNSANEVVAAKTTYMPSNICYIDDFEAYKTDLMTNDENNILPIKHITTRYTSAIVASAARNSDVTKAFKVCGRYGSYDYGCSTEQYPIPSGVHSNISLELDVLPGEDAGWFGITAAGAYPPALAGVNLSSEYISTKSHNQTSFTTDVKPTRGVWKHIKLDIDLFNNEYDVYIDNIKKNTESLPITGSLSAEGLTFGSSSTNKDTTCCYDNIKLVVDDSVTQIEGKSVYRKSATEAKLYYAANQPGVCRYIINDSPEAPTADNIVNNGFSTEQYNGGSIRVDIKGLTSGLKYLHFMHQGVNGGNSNIVTIKLPYDYFYTDDFNGYRLDDYPQEFTPRYCNGSVAKVEGDAPHNHAFKQGGGYGSYPEYHGNAYIKLPDYGEGMITFSADITPLTYNPGSIQLGNSQQYNSPICSVSIMGDHYIDNEHTQKVSRSYGNTYNYCLELDTIRKTYNYYIDGIKQNDEPLAANNQTLKADCIEFWTGSTRYGNQLLFDNLEMHILSLTSGSCVRTDANNANVNISTNTGGTLYYVANNSPKTLSIEKITSGSRIHVSAGVQNISFNNLTSGAQYLHCVVLNGNERTNYVTVALPEDAYCYYTSKDTDFSLNFEKVFSQTGLNLENAGEYVLEADFVSNEDASEEKEHILALKDDSSSPENMAGVSLKNGKLVLASNEETVLCDYTKGKTINIRILLNAETDKYSVLVDGQVYAKDISFHVNPTRFVVGVKPDTNAKFDNVKFFVPSFQVEHNFHLDYTPLQSISSQTTLESKKYFLDGDVSITGGSWYKSNSDTTVCLNGQTLMGSYTPGPIFHTDNSTDNLTLCDCTGRGVITAPATRGPSAYGTSAVLIQSNGTVNMTGGNILNVYTKDGFAGCGAGVWIDNGTFNMSGGTVIGCVSHYINGGGVYVSSNATFNICGAPVIKDNYDCGGTGSHIHDANCKKSDVYLCSNKVINLVDALTDGAQIGVTCAVAPTAGNPVVITSGYSEFCTENPSEFFFSNNDNYEIRWNSSRTEAALYLKSDPPTKFGVTINGLSETVTLTNYDYDGTIIVAFYKSNGVLVDLKTYQPQAIINAELPNEADSYAYTKVFWWKSLDTLRPLCDAVTINK